MASGTEILLKSQNPDGGWPYRPGGSSWVEPTAYALLALGDDPQAAAAARRARAWLAKLERPDGGWPPRPDVDQSTWVTALVLLLDAGRGELGPRALAWVMGQTGRESTLLHRVRMRLLGASSEYEAAPPAWPWYPGTAAWVVPTSLTMLALRKVQNRRPDPRVAARIEEGRRFLLVRRCADGGWNHGSSRALGVQSNSYPETTGLALLALDGVPPERLKSSLHTAERHLQNCRSGEGVAWLVMGLLAHGRSVLPGSVIRVATLVDAALLVLARRAAEGHNALLR